MFVACKTESLQIFDLQHRKSTIFESFAVQEISQKFEEFLEQQIEDLHALISFNVKIINFDRFCKHVKIENLHRLRFSNWQISFARIFNFHCIKIEDFNNIFKVEEFLLY